MGRFSGKARQAKRQKLFAAIGLIGPSGSGKTLSALRLAYGMMKAKYPEASEEELWKKIGLVDTEHERSLVYEGMKVDDLTIGSFIFIPFEPPYDPESYNDAQKELKKLGCEVCIFDSASHGWEGEGGILEIQQMNGGRFQDWKETNKDYRKFIDVVTGTTNHIHTINTLRTKQEYQVNRSEVDNKLEVVKLGTKPVTRDSLEYELQIVFNIDMDHIAHTSKDNTLGMFKKPRTLTEADGEVIIKWLELGEDIYAEQEKERQQYIGLIRGMETEVGEEITKLVQSLENHKAIQKPLEEFNLEWLEKTYGMVMQKAKEIETAKN